MRLLNPLYSFVLLLFFLCLVATGCSYTKLYYPYEYNGALQQQEEVLGAIILGYQTGEVPMSAANQKILRKKIEAYLVSSGISVADQSYIDGLIRKVDKVVGPRFDPATGQEDIKKAEKFKKLLLSRVKEDGKYNVIITPRIAIKREPIDVGKVYWDGVERSLYLSNSAPIELSGRERVASLSLTVFDIDGQQILHSFGGIDLIDAYQYDMRNRELNSVLRDEPLDKPEYYEEAIRIAFHPFIKNSDYPAEPLFMEVQ